jgi:hypothetical protein
MDPLMAFAEALRSKGGVECRAGVLGGERYELFRGKDLVRWVKAHPDKCVAAAAGEAGRAVRDERRRTRRLPPSLACTASPPSPLPNHPLQARAARARSWRATWGRS